MAYSERETKRKFEQLLRNHPSFFLQKGCTLDVLANKLGMNRCYASRFLNEVVGISFPQLVRDIRLKEAQRLMQDNPHILLSEVYQRVGFSNDMTFRRAYQAKFGVLPSHGRKEQR